MKQLFGKNERVNSIEKNEINRLIATKIMGLVEQVDFGTCDEHKWYMNDDGTRDDFALDTEFHHGPICMRCGYSFCIHCEDISTELCRAEIPVYTDSEITAWAVLKTIGKTDDYDISKHGECYRITIYPNTEMGARKRVKSIFSEGKDFSHVVCEAAALYAKKLR